MGKRPRQAPPLRQAAHPPGLLELDRFSAASLEQWKRLSDDLDELNSVLFFGLEPQRQKYRSSLLEALRAQPALPLSFTRWLRIVDYRYSNEPLSAAGSLTGVGGRFNVGMDVDQRIGPPWPALYLASDVGTAYREKYQLAQGAGVAGLSPEDLALSSHASTSNLCLSGHIDRVFDLGAPRALTAVCKVLGQMRLPGDVARLLKRLKIPARSIFLIKTPAQLQAVVLQHNWRIGPVQFGLPSPSQVLAELLRAAGYEAIRYPSTKTPGICLAVFPDNLGNDATFVELADPAPNRVRPTRLDLNTAADLCGWELLSPRERP